MTDNIQIRDAATIANYIKDKFGVFGFSQIALVMEYDWLVQFNKIARVIWNIEYKDIPHFLPLNLINYNGCFCLVELADSRKVLVMAGKFYLYDGLMPSHVVLPIVVLSLLGVNTLIIADVCGSINSAFAIEDMVIITDHINFTGKNPLIATGSQMVGQCFLDQTEPYSKGLIDLAKNIAVACTICPQDGVYLAVTGPTYETRAEIRAFHTMGADVVGMSNVCEVIMANYLKMRVLSIAIVTNMATGIAKTRHDYIKVMNTATRVLDMFLNWIKQIIVNI